MARSESTLLDLQAKAAQLRLMGLDMAQKAGSGHLGGAFSLAEIMSVLYFDVMNIDPQNPDRPARDRLVLSKGHATVALYPALALRGFFPIEHLDTFRRMDSDLSGHAEMHVPGVEMSTGSLGQGLSAAVGMALAARLHGQSYQVYAITGDGELQEGQIWEAAQFAAHHTVSNLTAIVDNNRLQLDGATCDIMNIRDVAAKFSAFGWHAQQADGHDVAALLEALDTARAETERPSVIVANTVKGKGVTFMENNVEYHGGHPDAEGFAMARGELERLLQSAERRRAHE